MKTLSFKNLWSPSFDKNILIGTTHNNERYFIPCNGAKNAIQLSRDIMRFGHGKVAAKHWQPYTA